MVKCPVYPTEDLEKVKSAVQNLFPSLVLKDEEEDDVCIVAGVSDLRSAVEWLRNRIHDLRIIDVVRSRIISSRVDNSTRVLLEKQSASIGRLRVVDSPEETPPLGFIDVQMLFQNSHDFEAFIAWFTPRTENGRIMDD